MIIKINQLLDLRKMEITVKERLINRAIFLKMILTQRVVLIQIFWIDWIYSRNNFNKSIKFAVSIY